MARRFAKNPEAVVVYSTASNPGRGNMKHRKKKHKKKKLRCRVKHKVSCNPRKHKRSKKRKGGRRRKVSAYARFVGAQMRKGKSMKEAARLWKKK